MFKKQQSKKTEARSAKRQSRAKVFSYYQNRAPIPEASRQGSGASRNLDRSDKRSGAKIFPVVLLGMVLLGCIFYITTLTSDPHLKISGSTAVNEDTTVVGRNLSSYEPEISSILNQSYLNRSKLLIDSEKVVNQIETNYPELGKVAIVLPFVGRRPIINVLPAKPELILTNGEGAYVVDIEGNALASASEVDRSIIRSLPVVQDQSGLPLEEGDLVLRRETVEFIKSLYFQFDDKEVDIETAFLPASTPYELHLKLEDEPYLVKFNIKGDSRLQSGTYFAVGERLGEEGVAPSNYIDVRVSEKAFYK